MRDQFRPAIEALQNDLADLERKVAETKATINRLCEIAEAPILYADVSAVDGGQPALGSIRADSFYGKVITTAAREYLEMRHNAGLGPASPRDFYEALKRGGFKFDVKNETNAIIGVRATLRKASAIFHRLPNGEYGLLKWYPRAKEEGTVPSKGNGKRGRPAKRGRPRKVVAEKPEQTLTPAPDAGEQATPRTA